MKTLKIFIFNTIILLISSICLQIITTFFNVYISNTIGEEAVGVFTLVISVYMFGITLASAGINIATTRIVAEELSCKNEVRCKVSC
jgi:stage V sporulation protein B